MYKNVSYEEFYKILKIYKNIWCMIQIKNYLKMEDKDNLMKCFMRNIHDCIQHFKYTIDMWNKHGWNYIKTYKIWI
jgi:hypothetical protein